MLQRFLGLDEGSILHPFFAIRQIGTVAEYHAQFEMLTATAGRIEELMMMVAFMNRSEDKIKAKLFVLNPTRLKEMMMTTTRIEKKNQVIYSQPIQKTDTS